MKVFFSQFLISEDVATEVINLQSQIASLQSRKAKSDKPLDDQIARLNKMLLLKQQQLSSEKQKESKQPGQAPQQTPQQSAQQTQQQP
jgi:hypothetical protein